MSDAAFGLALVEIVWINLLLSGDNAVVIAMASRSLPAPLQKWGIILGTIPAVLLRVTFTAVVSYLIAIPFLKIAGGGLLVWIAYRLLRPEQAGDADGKRLGSAACSIWTAARTIIIADAVMSLDNVVAIAAAAHGNMVLLILGLLISMPLVIGGATVLLQLLCRFPMLIIPGASLLGFIAGDLIVSDPWLSARIGGTDTPAGTAISVVIAATLAWAGFAAPRPSPASVYAPHRDAA